MKPKKGTHRSSKLYSEVYSVLDHKAKKRKRAREIWKEMKISKRACPFQEGSSGSNSFSSKPRGSNTCRANKVNQEKGDKTAFKITKANKIFKARYVVSCNYKSKQFFSTRNYYSLTHKINSRLMQYPSTDLRSKINRNQTQLPLGAEVFNSK